MNWIEAIVTIILGSMLISAGVIKVWNLKLERDLKKAVMRRKLLEHIKAEIDFMRPIMDHHRNAYFEALRCGDMNEAEHHRLRYNTMVDRWRREVTRKIFKPQPEGR